jgi:hypothetical protein
MVYNNERRDLKAFQRWVVTGLYRHVPWAEYSPSAKSTDERQEILSMKLKVCPGPEGPRRVI